MNEWMTRGEILAWARITRGERVGREQLLKTRKFPLGGDLTADDLLILTKLRTRWKLWHDKGSFSYFSNLNA